VPAARPVGATLWAVTRLELRVVARGGIRSGQTVPDERSEIYCLVGGPVNGGAIWN